AEPRVIGMVASDQTGLLLIASDGETSAFLYRLYLVGDVAAEFLVERLFERRDPPAQGEDGLLQMRDMLLEAGHPVLVVLDVIAIGQTERLGRRGECKSKNCGDDGCRCAHVILLPLTKLSVAARPVFHWALPLGLQDMAKCGAHPFDVRVGKSPVRGQTNAARGTVIAVR